MADRVRIRPRTGFEPSAKNAFGSTLMIYLPTTIKLRTDGSGEAILKCRMRCAIGLPWD